MMKTLRTDQHKVKIDTYTQWDDGVVNVLDICPTGFGKTVLASNIIEEKNVPTAVIAHRRELVAQFSLTLNENEVPHSIIATEKTIKFIQNKHREFHGFSTYHPLAQARLAGVDTFVNRKSELKDWLPQVRLWVQDEAHHVLKENKWGKARAMLPNAFGLGLTADSRRADGRGLGRHHDGVFDAIVIGPSLREVINAGNLKDYRIICPPSDFNIDDVRVGPSGEYVQADVKKAAQRSHITGDVVKSYLKFAKGKQVVTFATDVEAATEIAYKFNEAGVKTEVLTAKTHEMLRFNILRKFENKEIQNIVNVDLFGEGFDCPAIECVIMARPTASFMLYLQQFGRCLRRLAGVKHGIIIDHVGNVVLHGLPDKPRDQTLDRREKGARAKIDPDVIPLRPCGYCFEPYERTMNICPHCGMPVMIEDRSRPEQVDGDLIELDLATLSRLRGEAEYLMSDPANIQAALVAKGVPGSHARHIATGHADRQKSQQNLRDAIAWWAGHHRSAGRGDSEIYRRFYLRYNVDIATAQTLKKADADKLAIKVIGDYGK